MPDHTETGPCGPSLDADTLREQLAGTEAYAKEGWSWLSEALDALGAKTVFDIKQRGEVIAALESGPQGPEGEAPKQDPPVDWRVRSQGLEEDRNRLLSALERLRHDVDGILAQRSVRNFDETLAEADSALAGRSIHDASLGLPDEEGEPRKLRPDEISVGNNTDEDEGDGAAPPPRGPSAHGVGVEEGHDV